MHFNLCGCLLLLIFLPHFNFASLFPFNNNNNNNNNNDYDIPTEYSIHSSVPLKVSKITSSKTGTPHSYYSLPFCAPKETNTKDENIIEILSGDHIEDSLYEIYALEAIECRIINYQENVNDSKSCTDYNPSQLELFMESIRKNYVVHWTLDDLPAVVSSLVVSNGGKEITKHYKPGYPLGTANEDGIFINNHVDINIVYGEGNSPGTIIILGFEIAPRSQWYDPKSWEMAEEGEIIKNCPYNSLTSYSPQSTEPTDISDTHDNIIGFPNRGRRIYWSYSVHWELGEGVNWKHRWDLYLASGSESQIHLVSILNSAIIVLFLVVVTGSVVNHSLLGSNGAAIPVSDDVVGGDVSFALPLSVLIGSGVQVFLIFVLAIAFGSVGLLSPAYQGTYFTYLYILSIFTGIIAGFFSSYFYKLFRGQHRLKNVLFTLFSLPLFCLSLFLFCNLALHASQSSSALPYKDLLLCFVIWLAASGPPVLIGSAIGFYMGKEGRSHPSSSVRSVHKRLWYHRPLFSVFFAGVLPFGAVVIEYFFIVDSIWSWPIYNSHCYLATSLVTVIVTCTCTNIVVCSLHFSSGTFRWWWRPFLHGAASALYLFIYTIVIFFTTFHLQQSYSIINYFILAFFSSTIFFLLTGTTGFVVCYIFLKFILRNYSSPIYRDLVPINRNSHSSAEDA